MGFRQSVPDNSLFTRGEGAAFVALLVYVDDIVVASVDLAQIQQIKEHLNDVFHIKDLGHLRFFLGLEVARQKKGILISQIKYALELLDDAGFTDSKLVKSPTVPSHKLSKTNREFMNDPTHYRRLFGKLLYLTITRLDVFFATQQLSQFLDKPTSLLRYIEWAPRQGLFLMHLPAFN